MVNERTPLLHRSSQQHLKAVNQGSHLQQAFPRRNDSIDDQADLSDNDKSDRRSGTIGRVCRYLISCCRRRSGSLSSTNKDDEMYYYEDTYNDDPWSCSFGTKESDGIWMNFSDPVGTLMASTVWILVLYSCFTMILLTRNHYQKIYNTDDGTNQKRSLSSSILVTAVYCTICALALASHAKTSLTDPGAVPEAAVPLATNSNKIKFHTVCSLCQSYKPPNQCHHCRICNRCICRMDHHCPWMNNCVGARNLKHFILFLLYIWTGSALALLIFARNYFFCTNPTCEYTGLEAHLVRLMTIICVGSLLFTSSMIVSVVYGILTGVGTIDRLKKRAAGAWNDATEETIPLRDIFGIAPVWMWWLPVDPIFADHDRIMGYATRQRLLREEALHRAPGNKLQQQMATMSSPIIYDKAHGVLQV